MEFQGDGILWDRQGALSRERSPALTSLGGLMSTEVIAFGLLHVPVFENKNLIILEQTGAQGHSRWPGGYINPGQSRLLPTRLPGKLLFPTLTLSTPPSNQHGN